MPRLTGLEKKPLNISTLAIPEVIQTLSWSPEQVITPTVWHKLCEMVDWFKDHANRRAAMDYAWMMVSLFPKRRKDINVDTNDFYRVIEDFGLRSLKQQPEMSRDRQDFFWNIAQIRSLYPLLVEMFIENEPWAVAEKEKMVSEYPENSIDARHVAIQAQGLSLFYGKLADLTIDENMKHFLLSIKEDVESKGYEDDDFLIHSASIRALRIYLPEVTLHIPTVLTQEIIKIAREYFDDGDYTRYLEMIFFLAFLKADRVWIGGNGFEFEFNHIAEETAELSPPTQRNF